MIAHKIAAELLTGIRRAAALLTGAKRRRFQAEIATQYCRANPRQTESWFGFNRHAVQRGLLEKETGQTLRKTPERRGRPKVEDKLPRLAQLTDQALSETAQMDPKFQTTIAYTRVTGKQLRESFSQALGIAVGKLPVARTLRRLMNRRNFSLRRVRKTQPLKKIKQTDAIRVCSHWRPLAKNRVHREMERVHLSAIAPCTVVGVRRGEYQKSNEQTV